MAKAHPSGQDGFALVVVIWAIGAVALLFTTYIAAARYRAIEAFATFERAKAETMANAGVNLGIAEMLSNLAKGPAAASAKEAGLTFLCSMGGKAIVAVTVTNENGRVDLNTAQSELLQTLLAGSTGDDARAKKVTRLIVALRDAAAEPGTAAGPTPPAAAPRAFRSVVELGQLPGVSQSDYAGLAPFVTVHSRSPGLNPKLAAPALLDVLSRGSPPGGKSGQSPDAASAFFLAEAPGNLYRIDANAVTASGARFTREAIIEVTRGPPLSYSVKEWGEGAGRGAASVGSAAALPGC